MASTPRTINRTDVAQFAPLIPLYLFLFTLMSAHFFVAWWVSLRTIDQLLPLRHFATVMVLGTMPVLGFSLIVALKITHRRVEKPASALVRTLRRNRAWIIRSIGVFALLLPSAQAFVALKVAIPRIEPFYADPYLVRIDRWLFFGFDPWRITHAIANETATVAIDAAYAAWAVAATGVMLWAAFDRDPRFQFVAVASLFCIWAGLGNLLAVQLSSVGPIFYQHFYGSPYFAPLMANLSPDLILFEARSFLLANFGEEQFGSGISAAPSLHVAVTTLLFLMVREKFRNRWLTFTFGFYLGLIVFGSVHLAWHYAVDGLISIALVVCIWRLVSFVTDLSLRSRPPVIGNG